MPRTLSLQQEEGARRGAEPGAAPVGGPSADPAAALSLNFRKELLDPAAWQEGLEKYARAMHLAVALVDTDGHLLGQCLNPQPLWGLLHARQPAGAGECPFSLRPVQVCTCVADALHRGRVVQTRDRTGLVHFAVPLVLGGEKLGALVAGQVFDQFPEQLPLERAATQLGLSPATVWQKARLEHPVSLSMLEVYEELLATLGQAFLQSRYHTLSEAARLAALGRAQAALRRANDELERRVEERSAELKEAQKQALQAERLAAIGQMVTGLAHESRNALQRSQACLEMLRFRLEAQPEALDLLTRLQKAQDDLHRLYEGVGRYAGPIPLSPCLCDLAQVWQEAWADLAPPGGSRAAELQEETGDLDLHCLADPFQLKQVFRNLLDNALAAGAQRVAIRCSGAELDGRPAVKVAVQDNGSGISPGDRGKLFEPFYTTKVHGTGLGLAICKRIVGAHGGRIAVGADKSPGAEILVILPRRGA